MECIQWMDCFALMPFIPARKAYWFMNTNQFTAFGTNPFLFFIQNEMSDPEFIYYFKIVDHAHSVFCPISLIQLFQPGTGKFIATIGTIFDFSFGEFFAVFDSA